jgi:2-phosphosulfolactate phosphatase
MPAPDLAKPTPETIDRPTLVYLSPSHVEPAALAGGIVVMIDTLRASTTMTRALANGAREIVPTLTVDEAISTARELRDLGLDVLLGGERSGQLIPGFDLDNSPASYTADRVRDRIIVFTTTNGTAALRHATLGSRVLVGSLCNLSALCDAIATDPRPVHILCAGTRGEISADDATVAGAIAARLVSSGRAHAGDDAGRLCAMAWASIAPEPGREPATEAIATALLACRGGRNLARIGLARDVLECAAIDTSRVVPVFTPDDGRVRIL